MVLYGSKWHVKIMWKRATVLVSPMFFQYTKGRSSAFHKPICGEVCRSAVASTVLWTGGTMQEASLIFEGSIPLGPQNLRMHVNVTNIKKKYGLAHVHRYWHFSISPTPFCVCARVRSTSGNDGEVCSRCWEPQQEVLASQTNPCF